MSFYNQFKLPDGIPDSNATATGGPTYTQAEIAALKQNFYEQGVLDAKAEQGYMPSFQNTQTGAGSDMYLSGRGMKASGTAAIIGGAFDVYQGIRNLRDARGDVNRYQGRLDELYENQPSISTPSEYYMMAKNAYDARLMQMRVDDINRGLASTTAAATQFGSRGLGAIPGATEAANRAQQEEVLRQQQLQTSAMGELAGAQQQTQQMQLQQNQFNQSMSFEQLQLANQAVAGAQEQIGAGVGAIAGGVTSSFLGGDVMSMGTDLLPEGMKLPESNSFFPIQRSREEGGKIQKTPGKFSHEENEMAVVTEEGDDTGIRVTGGEYVINPEQSKRIKKLVESGDADALLKFMDNLLDEPQFA